MKKTLPTPQVIFVFFPYHRHNRRLPPSATALHHHLQFLLQLTCYFTLHPHRLQNRHPHRYQVIKEPLSPPCSKSRHWPPHVQNGPIQHPHRR
ncbi:hypothetical protein Hanom_Chr12g01076521 [Helianthus anomalus]